MSKKNVEQGTTDTFAAEISIVTNCGDKKKLTKKTIRRIRKNWRTLLDEMPLLPVNCFWDAHMEFEKDKYGMYRITLTPKLAVWEDVKKETIAVENTKGEEKASQPLAGTVLQTAREKKTGKKDYFHKDKELPDGWEWAIETDEGDK